MIKNTTIEADSVQIKIVVNKNPLNRQKGRNAIIRIKEDVYDDLVKLSVATGMHISELASEMIRFAKDKTAIIEKAEDLGSVQQEESISETTTPQIIEKGEEDYGS